MTFDGATTAQIRFSNRAMARGKRSAALRDYFEQRVQLAIDVPPNQIVDMTIDVWPGLRRATMTSPITARLTRPAPMLGDGEDSVCLMINTGGRLALRQCGREALPDIGDAVMLAYREPAVIDFSRSTYLAVRIPSKAIAPLVKDVGSVAARCVPRTSDAMTLLSSYVASMPAQMADPRLGRVAATHLYDLIALALGATPDGHAAEARQSLGAVRLNAIKADIIRDAGVALADLALRHRVSPRYVQMLFERDGSTFSDFVLACRLDKARAMLTSPRYDGWSVTSLALEAGFGDLSYFNRCFKRRFETTPTDMRKSSRVAGVSGE